MDTRRLAIDGGEPAFSAPVYVGRPNIGDRAALQRRFDQILDSRWLSNNGAQVQEFGSRLESYLGVKHVIPVCNATVALMIVARALGMKGEVIVPSFTFVATAHALEWQGIKPVFCDVDPATHNLDPSRVEELVTPQTSGILGVHLWGNACAVRELDAISKRHNLLLAYDSAHAFGCAFEGRRIGGFGMAEVFSFHATKFVNSFEGGAIATDDDDLAKRIRLMINFGFVGYDDVQSPGTNGKMCEISAAMGITSLDALEEIVSLNRVRYDLYRSGLSSVQELSFLTPTEGCESNWQYVVGQVSAESKLSRDRLVDILWKENVIARKYFYPGVHRMQPYATTHPHAGERLPVTEDLCQRVFVLPSGSGVSEDDVRLICEIIRLAFEQV